MTTPFSLEEFIWNERMKYDDVGINDFAIPLGPVLTYYDFVQIVTGRYEKAVQGLAEHYRRCQAIVRERSGELPPEVAEELLSSSELTALLHLEIESFYLFSKILLDKIAHFIQDYFGQARGCSLASHDKLVKNHAKFGDAKNLRYPDGFTESLDLLKRKICDYRDKEVTHLQNPRASRATAFDAGGQAVMIPVGFFPRGDDLGKRASSSKLSELVEAIDLYLRQVAELVAMNRDKSRHKLRGQE